MAKGFLGRLFGDVSRSFIAKHTPAAAAINGLEPEIAVLKDEALKERSARLKARHQAGTDLEAIIPEAFGLAREAAKRTLGQRHFDVQLLGGLALHEGKIAEMRTGEGKTLVATLPAYLNALSGKGVHIVTVNDYLARRDAAWMGQIYHLLGVRVGCITQDEAYEYDPTFDPARDSTQAFQIHPKSLRPVSRRDAYQLDVVYATNNTIGFDYLRDNLVYQKEQLSQRPFHYAIVDEIDSILIDEARTPLIISSPDTASSELYRTFAKVVPKLVRDVDYTVDEKMRSVVLTEKGISRVEDITGVKNFYEGGNIDRIFHLEQALKAEVLYKRDHQYIVREGQVVIVDEFTGRLMPDRRFSEGLHQALEAKEGVAIKEESKTLATITFQNLFRKYPKLAGMTGTAATSEEEFYKVYGLEVVTIPTNKPMIRVDHTDSIYRTERGKIQAIVREVAERHAKGQPVLIGTVSIEKNELIGAALVKARIPHEILNAKNHEREGSIIAQAGRQGAVTVATNMAGRGVDIMLGGNPPLPEEAEFVRKAGGLFVLGTERHEARRIDDQLRGRSGRQGDPGESRFFVSMEDDVMRVFGSDRAKNMMARLGFAEDQAIEHSLVSKALEKAQEKIEGFNFDIRKYVLEYDEVLNKQREAVYRMRREALFADEAAEGSGLKEHILEMADEAKADLLAAATAAERVEHWDIEEILKAWQAFLPPDFQNFEKAKLTAIISEHKTSLDAARVALGDYLSDAFRRAFANREAQFGADVIRQVAKIVLLSSIDMFWTAHLDTMEHLRESVRLRAYGQQDPLVEYRREGARLFDELKALIANQVLSAVLRVVPAVEAPPPRQPQLVAQRAPVTTPPSGGPTSTATVLESAPMAQTPAAPELPKIGRNDPCPCGSGKKYKRCHGA